jgi:hypothetical protein
MGTHLQFWVQLCRASQRERSSLIGPPPPLAVDLQLISGAYSRHVGESEKKGEVSSRGGELEKKCENGK